VRKADADEGKRAELLSSQDRGSWRRCARTTASCAAPSRFSRQCQRFRRRAHPTPNEMSAFIEEHHRRFGVEPICMTLGRLASAYYARQTGRRSSCSIEDERLLARIEESRFDQFEVTSSKAAGPLGFRPPSSRVLSSESITQINSGSSV